MNFNLKKMAIDRFSAWLLSSEVWGHAQAAVKIVESPDKSGPEKRQAAIDLLKAAFVGLASLTLNLAVELAVCYIKEQRAKS